tara:strand:- start:268 stop:639 length:372 start_codon:yes stop_codon:yes gene_type:complete
LHDITTLTGYDVYVHKAMTMQTHTLALGMNIPNAGKVNNQMWMQFVSNELATRLQFATITDALGIYKGEIEQTKLVSITVDERTSNSSTIVAKLQEVGQVYKTQFRQEAVLYTKTETPEMAFI